MVGSGNGAGQLPVLGHPTALHIVGQGPAVLAAGAGRVGYFFIFSSCLSYLPFLMPHLL